MHCEDDYLKWIANEIDGANNYTSLLAALNRKQFIAEIQDDENRLMNGRLLRIRFLVETGLESFSSAQASLPIECSVLDVMVDLAIRVGRDVLGADDSIPNLFWDMVCCMGLECMTDNSFNPNYVDETLNKFVNRQYNRNGRGGLFMTSDPSIDMRCFSIWDQMMIYLNEIFPY